MSHFYFDSETNGHKSFEIPGARPHYTRNRPRHAKHIFLGLALDIPNQSFGGTCTIALDPVRNGIHQLTLDAVNLNIQSVQVEGTPQPFDYDGEQLHIRLINPTEAGKEIKIAIAYSVEKPQRGLYFIVPNQHYPNKPTQVWTQGEDEDSRFWFPCFDYPGQLATSEIRVKVPKRFIAISNGELITTEEAGEDKIYHWLQQQVHPTYLMTLAVGDFAEIRDEWNGKPVTYYVEKGYEEDARRSMGKTPQMIEFFSEWFGDLVVIKHWSHAWIKEGMASYSEVFWTEQEYGADDAAYYLLGEARSYISEDSSRYRRPIVTHVYREAIELYDRHLYEKGACVYHMIRTELGDQLFWKAIQTFVQDNAHNTVETVDLLRAIEKATGRNLLFLFDQYVFRGGHPDYKVAYSWDGDSQLAKVTVTQTQAKNGNNGSSSELFDLKIPIAFGYTQQESGVRSQESGVSSNVKLKTFTLRVHEREQSFYFPLEKKPQFISFDQGNNYLKTVSLEYPIPELKAQLQSDPDPISRIYAAKALAKKGGLEAVKALSESLTSDAFWGVRTEVAKQLAQVKLDQASEAVIAGLKDEDARVRRSVVEALSK